LFYIVIFVYLFIVVCVVALLSSAGMGTALDSRCSAEAELFGSGIRCDVDVWSGQWHVCRWRIDTRLAQRGPDCFRLNERLVDI